MCPLCISTAALTAVGAASSAGLLGMAAKTRRTLRRWTGRLVTRKKDSTS